MDKRTRLYAELQDASKAEREADIGAHRVQSIGIKSALARLQKNKSAKMPKVPLDFLAIGNSWFEYPLDGNGPSWVGNTAIVAQTQLGSMGNPPPSILNLALHGQATTAMLSFENQQQIISVLQDPGQWLNEQTGLPDGILVSAGGDDLVGDQFAIYLDYGAGGLDVHRFNGVLDSVEASYKDLFALRDIFAPNVPIVAHCYDYAIPNGVHPICFARGWLKPSLDFAGYDYATGLGIVKDMIDLFYKRLTDLANDGKNKFTVIDTRNTLTRDATQPDGWANEIHPYFTGFTSLAQTFLAGLQSMTVFKGRI